VALPVVLVLAVQFIRVRSPRLRAVDHPRRGARCLRHRGDGDGGGGRGRIRLVTTSGIAGLEGATAAARHRVGDGSAHRHVAALPVGVQTTVVADVVQVLVAAESIARRRANEPHHAGEGVRGTGASVGAEAGALKMEGTRKGHLAGVEVGLGVRVRARPAEKVGAKEEI
jgi:hypothetical protein